MNTAARQITRQRFLIGLVLLVLALYAMFGVLDARSASNRLADAREDLAEIERMLDEIRQMKRAPKVAALQHEPPGEITKRIAAAFEVAGLPPVTLESLDPDAPQRMQRTDFKLRSTTIRLKPATLPQIAAFCEALRDQETGSIVRDITLSEPENGRAAGGQEKWAAQLILTQMIFSPTSRS